MTEEEVLAEQLRVFAEARSRMNATAITFSLLADGSTFVIEIDRKKKRHQVHLH